jgi:hypothetical protein
MVSCFTRIPPTRLVPLALPLALLLACAAGCGMTEYEARLKEDAARVKQIEAERQALGEPFDMPMPLPPKKDSDEPPRQPPITEATLFLRPPKLFQCTKQPVLVSGGKGVDLYGYRGGDGKHVLAAAAPADIEQAEFERQVWAAFQYYLESRLDKSQIPGEPKQKKQEDRTPPKTGKDAPVPLRYDIWVWDEPEPAAPPKGPPDKAPSGEQLAARYYLCFTRQSNANIAVIYQLPVRADDAAMQKALELSQRALATGPEASKRLQAGSKAH